MTKFFTCLAALASGLGLIVGAATAAESLPAYQLSVGQKLVYSVTSESKKEKSENDFTVSTTWNVYVASRDKDQNWRLIGQRVMSWRRGKPGEDAAPVQEDSALVSFQLNPNGHITWKGAIHFGLDPSDLFPRLPASVSTAAKGWSFVDVPADTEHNYRLAPSADPAAGKWIFWENRSNPTSLVVGRDRRTEFHFDVARGLVDRSEDTDPSDPDSAVLVTKLESVTAEDEKWIARLVADYDRYVVADEQAGRLQQRAQKDPEAFAKLWSEAEGILKQARAAVETPLIQETLDRQIVRQARDPSAVQRRAESYAELRRQPPLEWEATDLKGTKHSLAEYRGKVVILDFWYRGCGWCIRAMPQVKQVAAHFDGQPVAVLGVNVDTNESDANWVVEKLKLPYPNLKAGEIPQQYKVRGYPTLIVIDTEGKVSDVHYGYSHTLKDELIRSITGLLP